MKKLIALRLKGIWLARHRTEKEDDEIEGLMVVEQAKIEPEGKTKNQLT